MKGLYDYIISNFSLSGESQRIIESVLCYVVDEDMMANNKLTIEGVSFIYKLVGCSIGMSIKEIVENWN